MSLPSFMLPKSKRPDSKRPKEPKNGKPHSKKPSTRQSKSFSPALIYALTVVVVFIIAFILPIKESAPAKKTAVVPSSQVQKQTQDQSVQPQPEQSQPEQPQPEQPQEQPQPEQPTPETDPPPQETPGGEVRVAETTRQEIPAQQEDLSLVDANTMAAIRQALVNAKGYSAEYSNDCQNIAILRANGAEESAGALFAKYGNTVSWYECSVHNYCADLSSDSIAEIVAKLAKKLKASTLPRYGIGINVSKENDYFKIKAVEIFSS